MNLDELKEAVREAVLKMESYFDHALTDEIKFLAKHGPALIAAVELAEATIAMEDGLEGPDGFGDINLVRDYKRAMDAYRATKPQSGKDGV